MEKAVEVAAPMENIYVTRREFEEYQRRLEDKKDAWDKDLAEVKAEVKELRELTNAVSKLAQNMENMMKEQERTSGRLDAIERRDGEMWRKVVSHIVTTIVGAALMYLASHYGI